VLRVLAAAGATVLAAATDEAMLDVTIARIDNPPHPIQAVPLKQLEEHWATIDAVFINPPDVETAATVDPWLAIARDAVAAMRNRGHAGSVVFISGIERSGTTGSLAAYMRSELEDMAASVAPNAIRVNAVACGPIGSTRRGQPQSHRATPLGHVTVHPVEVGKAAWFLLNDEISGAVTGATLRVDRGASLNRPDW
jgi:hypothetical protein